MKLSIKIEKQNNTSSTKQDNHALSINWKMWKKSNQNLYVKPIDEEKDYKEYCTLNKNKQHRTAKKNWPGLIGSALIKQISYFTKQSVQFQKELPLQVFNQIKQLSSKYEYQEQTNIHQLTFNVKIPNENNLDPKLNRCWGTKDVLTIIKTYKLLFGPKEFFQLLSLDKFQQSVWKLKCQQKIKPLILRSYPRIPLYYYDLISDEDFIKELVNPNKPTKAQESNTLLSGIKKLYIRLQEVDPQKYPLLQRMVQNCNELFPKYPINPQINLNQSAGQGVNQSNQENEKEKSDRIQDRNTIQSLIEDNSSMNDQIPHQFQEGKQLIMTGDQIVVAGTTKFNLNTGDFEDQRLQSQLSQESVVDITTTPNLHIQQKNNRGRNQQLDAKLKTQNNKKKQIQKKRSIKPKKLLVNKKTQNNKKKQIQKKRSIKPKKLLVNKKTGDQFHF